MKFISCCLATAAAVAQTCAAQETGVAAQSAVMNVLQASAEEASAGPPRRPRAAVHPQHRRRRVLPPFLPESVEPPHLTAASTAPTRTAAMNGFPALMDDFTAVPPDTTGAVGPQHVVTTLNTSVQFQTRSGEVKAGMSLEKFWSNLASTDSATDPRILYDPAAKRWTASAVSMDVATSALLIATSRTADPTGDWNLFRIPVDPVHQWLSGDYDVLGFNSTWITVSVDLYDAFDLYQQTNLYVFTKSDLYAGKAPFRMFHNQQGPFIPATDYDNTLLDRMFFLQEDLGWFSGLIVSEIQGTAGSEVFLDGRGYVKPSDSWQNSPTDSFEFAPQLGSIAKIDTGDSRLQNCLLRNNSVWCAHTIFLPASNPNRSAVQWWQVNPTQYQVMQRGRIDDPTGATFYAYPSIAVNKNGDVLIAYNRFSATQYASANFSFRAATDPAGATQADTVIKPGEAPYRSQLSPTNRWGDYSQTLVDPADDLSFWTIQEYASSPFAGVIPRWGTWWAQITLLPSGTACAWTLSRSAQSFPPAGGAGSVDVTTSTGCNWMAAANAGWITLPNGAQNGSASGTVTYTVAANQSASLRTATLTIAGQTFTVTQASAPPAPDLVLTSLTAPTTATIGSQIAVAVTAKNQGTASAAAFRIGFYFGSSAANTGQAVFSGSSCAVDKGLAVAASITCNQQVLVPSTVNPGTGFLIAIADDQNAVSESDHGNNARLSDSGPITILAAPVPRPSFAAAGITNAASHQGGALAPGEFVDLVGDNLGPADPRSDASFPTLLAGTRVLFDGVASPLRSVSRNKVGLIVPFAVAGQTVAQVQVEYNGAKSDPLMLPVSPSAPGIFAVFNPDGTLNSPDAPAAPLSVLTLAVTGAGQTDPPALDGQIAGDPPPPLVLPVSATVGGVDARVVSAGPVPGVVAGMIQVSLEVPPDAAPDDAAPLVVTVGDASSPPITVAIAPAPQ